MGDGLVEVHRTDDGIVWSIEAHEAGQTIYRARVARGTHLLQAVEFTDGTILPDTRVTYDYGMSPAEMPIPAPGQRWRVSVHVTDGSGTRGERQMQAYGATTEVTIGACSYDMIPVLIAYQGAGFLVEQVNYLPALGIGYLVDTRTDDDPGHPVAATAIWIVD